MPSTPYSMINPGVDPTHSSYAGIHIKKYSWNKVEPSLLKRSYKNVPAARERFNNVCPSALVRRKSEEEDSIMVNESYSIPRWNTDVATKICMLYSVKFWQHVCLLLELCLVYILVNTDKVYCYCGMLVTDGCGRCVKILVIYSMSVSVCECLWVCVGVLVCVCVCVCVWVCVFVFLQKIWYPCPWPTPTPDY